ncbi:MAG TPA: thioredoxin [Draconibacterium sp.]|nr:thioredoxin [Draconibacterium sp.]HRX12907.1 thioredoxin [Draconibacterium sp.]
MNERFLNIINSDKPVLVDFFADWCEPCKQMAPILKDVKMELKESIRILKVNVDKNPVIATKYQIRNIPTVIIFKNGQPQWKGVGVKPAYELTSILRQHINLQQ